VTTGEDVEQLVITRAFDDNDLIASLIVLIFKS